MSHKATTMEHINELNELNKSLSRSLTKHIKLNNKEIIKTIIALQTENNAKIAQLMKQA